MKLKQTGELAPVNKPWQLIRDAVADLTLQEKTPGIEIDMDAWHVPLRETCRQCLAGVVISRRLGVDTGELKYPGVLPVSVSCRLQALNCFRTSHVGLGLKKLGYSLDVREAIEERTMRLDIVHYSRNKEGFKGRLLELADILEANLTLEKTLRKIPKKIK